jgi:hypothetical protein
MFLIQDAELYKKSEAKFKKIMDADDYDTIVPPNLKKQLPENPTSLQRVLHDNILVDGSNNKNYNINEPHRKYRSIGEGIDSILDNDKYIEDGNEFDGYNTVKFDNVKVIDAHYTQFQIHLPENTMAGYILNIYDNGMLIMEKKLFLGEVLNKTVLITADLEIGKHEITHAVRNDDSFIEDESTPIIINVDTSTVKGKPFISKN